MTSRVCIDRAQGATEYGMTIMVVATGAAVAATAITTHLRPIWTLALAVLQHVGGA